MSLHARRPPRGVERRFGGCEVGFSRGASRAFRGARLIGGGAIRSRFQGEERSQASHRAPLRPAPEPHSRAWCEGAFPKAEHRARRSPRRSPRRSRGGHAVVTEPSIGAARTEIPGGGSAPHRARRVSCARRPCPSVRPLATSCGGRSRSLSRLPVPDEDRLGARGPLAPCAGLSAGHRGRAGESGGRTSPHGPRASRSRRVA